MAIASRVSLVVAELIVLVITWMKMKDGRRSGPSLTLSNVFYENGELCVAFRLTNPDLTPPTTACSTGRVFFG